MIITSEFDSYKVHYGSGPYLAPAQIYLYKSGSYVGRLRFIRDDLDIPQNSAPMNKPVLNYPSKSFHEVLDIIRNEKPLYLFLHTINWGGSISTLDEPVGEEES